MLRTPLLFQIWEEPELGFVVGNPGAKIPPVGESDKAPLGIMLNPPAFVLMVLELEPFAF